MGATWKNAVKLIVHPRNSLAESKKPQKVSLQHMVAMARLYAASKWIFKQKKESFLCFWNPPQMLALYWSGLTLVPEAGTWQWPTSLFRGFSLSKLLPAECSRWSLDVRRRSVPQCPTPLWSLLIYPFRTRVQLFAPSCDGWAVALRLPLGWTDACGAGSSEMALEKQSEWAVFDTGLACLLSERYSGAEGLRGRYYYMDWVFHGIKCFVVEGSFLRKSLLRKWQQALGCWFWCCYVKTTGF